jgi:hypothetical protein
MHGGGARLCCLLSALSCCRLKPNVYGGPNESNLKPTSDQVEVRLVLRAGRPALDPPVEELRLRHYRDQLGGFLGLPGKMKVRLCFCWGVVSRCVGEGGWAANFGELVGADKKGTRS